MASLNSSLSAVRGLFVAACSVLPVLVPAMGTELSAQTAGVTDDIDLASDPVRIAMVGDSILESYGGAFSSRYYLNNLLVNAGHRFDFVGSAMGVFGGPPADPNFDQDHIAYSGWRIDHHLPLIEGRLEDAKPDIVVVHLGTNDLILNHTLQSTIDELSELVDRIHNVNPKITVLLSQLIPMGNRDVRPLNAAIPGIAAAKDSLFGRVLVVDQYSNFVPAQHFGPDNLHPNDAGEQLMAEAWFEALLPCVAPDGLETTYIGTGCAGSAGEEVVKLIGVRGQAPSLGNPWTAQFLTADPTQSVFGLIGFEDPVTGAAHTPLDLSVLGAPGCSLMGDIAIALPLPSDGVSESRFWTLQIPDSEFLVSNSFYIQGLAFGASNPFGVVTSNLVQVPVVAGR